MRAGCWSTLAARVARSSEVRRVAELLIRRPTTVRFGGLHSTDEVRFDVSTSAAVASPTPTTDVTAERGTFVTSPRPAPVATTEAGDGPVVLDRPNRPGGRLAPNAAAGATEIVDQSLSVQFGGQTVTVHPGQSLTLGRDAGVDLRSDNPTISRHHARIRFEGGAWWLEDLDSSRGTLPTAGGSPSRSWRGRWRSRSALPTLASGS